MRLSEYLDAARDADWVWGYSDCTQFASTWVFEATGLDPGLAFRGKYSTMAGAHRFVSAAGGLVELVSAEMERCGFEVTERPEHGDVGIVEAPYEMTKAGLVIRQVSAIRFASMWAVRALSDLRFADFPTVKAWSIS